MNATNLPRYLLTIVAVLGAFAAGWMARHTAGPRYQLVQGDRVPLIKIDTRTGETWRYYVNPDQAQGFTRTQDRDANGLPPGWKPADER